MGYSPQSPWHCRRTLGGWRHDGSNGYAPDASRAFQVMSYGAFAGTFTDYSGLDVGWWSREVAQKIVLAPPYPGNS